MKKISIAIVFLTIFFTITINSSAADIYESGFIPMESSCFLGVQDIADTGWYSEGGHLSLQTSGGYKGNSYLQFEAEGDAISPKIDLAPYLTETGTFTLNIYIRLSDIQSDEKYFIQAKAGEQLLTEFQEPIRQNKWFLYSSPITVTEVKENGTVFEFVSLPEECSRLCIDAFAVLPYQSSGVSGGGTSAENNENTGNSSFSGKGEFEWYSDLRNKSVGTVRGYYSDGLLFGGICLGAAIVISAVILLVPFKKVWKKIRHKASAE